MSLIRAADDQIAGLEKYKDRVMENVRLLESFGARCLDECEGWEALEFGFSQGFDQDSGSSN